MLPGGDYRLCWCPYISNNSDAESVCLAEDFATDVGRFELIGLSPLQQDRTCISGQRCSFQFQGNHLSENDTLLVAETCGTVEVMRRFAENAGMAQSVTRSGAHVSFGPVTAAGGQFQLCWCSGSLGKVCNEDFSMTVGSLNIMGPTPLFQDAQKEVTALCCLTLVFKPSPIHI